jgi:hypothetical protein
MAEVATQGSREVSERKKAVGKIHQELKLSLAQGESLPELLMYAPLAINFLGQIKLLAFSDHATRVQLTKPETGAFKHLR